MAAWVGAGGHLMERQPRGVPTGGQFAPTLHTESPVQLDVTPTGPTPVNGMRVLGTTETGHTDKVDEDGYLITQVRLENRKPNDAPDGTAAIISYSPHGTEETFYTNGVLHDGSGATPSRRYTGTNGKTVLTRGYRTAHGGMIVPQDSPDGQPARVAVYSDAEDSRRRETAWMMAGRRQDPSSGVPALSTEMADGGRKHVHFSDGREDDLDDGTPAQRHFDKDGNLTFEGRYYDGFPSDSDDGDPAFRKWRPDGTLEKEWRFCSGQLLDSEGKAAITGYAEDGQTILKEERHGSSQQITGRRLRAEEWPYKQMRQNRETGGG